MFECKKKKTTDDFLRERSGNINSKDKVTSFLYILMRDHLPVGTVEKILREHCNNEQAEFSNGWLARVAIDMSARLKDG